MNDKKQPTPLEVDLDDKTADGIYSNIAMVAHSADEFVFDFASRLPYRPSAKIMSRIILSPAHAKQFLKALEDNIMKYESTHSVIREDGMTPFFGGKSGQA